MPSSLPPRPRPRSRRAALRRALCWAASLALLAFLALALAVDRYGQVESARPADAIVVLGARVNAEGQPGDSLHARTLHAVDLYRRGLAPRIVCTGGVGDHPPSDARATASLAMRCGVPEACLILEERSTSTFENLANVAAICREHGWSRVIVVSDPYHLWRARRLCRRAGLAAYPSPALDCERNRRPLLRLQWTLREGVLIVREVALRR